MPTDFLPFLSRVVTNCTLANASNDYFDHSPNATHRTFPFLSPAVGYGIVLVFGLVFGLMTVALVYLDQYFFRRVMNSEFFNTAGRSVRTGLTASVIVSQWTWAATLLQSTSVAFRFGVSGPLWYAAGASVQIILFSMIAILVKLRAPTCHTFLEIIRARWGTVAHIVFLCFAVATNVIVTSMLVVAASDVVHAVTTMNLTVATLLIPLGVIFYTLAGGLKATFVASYFNTSIILLSLVIFMFAVYVAPHSDPNLGSINSVYDALKSSTCAVEKNRDSSYLTILSLDGFFFGLVNLIGNFGTVFIDQSYWQSAIAATPSASWKGYILGGFCWFAIPFSLSTSLGLAAVAAKIELGKGEVDKGLVLPAIAEKLLGNFGSWLSLIMLFMAVVSSGASEQIAFSSLMVYDVYRTYINPNCSGQKIISLSRWIILIYGVVMGAVGIGFHEGLDLNFLYLFMGVIIGPAVVPVAYSITWGRASGRGAVLGAISGLICGLTVWLSYGATFGREDDIVGAISFIERLKEPQVMVVGNLTSVVISAVVSTVVSLLHPDDCDWSTTRAIPLIEDDPNAHIPYETEESLYKALRKIGFIGVTASILLIVMWPTLALPAGVFSRGYFIFWVVLAFVWGIVSCVIMVVMPLIESRHGILTVLSGGKLANRMRRTNDEDVEDSFEDFVIEDR